MRIHDGPTALSRALTDTARQWPVTTLSRFGRFLTLIHRRLQLGLLRHKNADCLNVNLQSTTITSSLKTHLQLYETYLQQVFIIKKLTESQRQTSQRMPQMSTHVQSYTCTERETTTQVHNASGNIYIFDSQKHKNAMSAINLSEVKQFRVYSENKHNIVLYMNVIKW